MLHYVFCRPAHESGETASFALSLARNWDYPAPKSSLIGKCFEKTHVRSTSLLEICTFHWGVETTRNEYDPVILTNC
jgi:hypothetical protein